MLRKQDHLPAALESYRASLANAERLAKADPGNVAWQGAPGAVASKIGDVLREEGHLAAALESYRASLAIAERLAKTDPGNAVGQRPLLAHHTKIGDVLRDQDDLPAALESYRAALAIAERLAKTDPGFSQRTLAISHERVAMILVRQDGGNSTNALRSWRSALGAAEKAAAAAEEVETKGGGKPGAATAKALGYVAWRALLAREFQKALDVSERAHTAAPELIWIDTNRAHALLFLKRTREARALYLTHKGKVSVDRPWEKVIADDFVKLRKAGLSHPLMAEIEGTLGRAALPKTKSAPRQTSPDPQTGFPQRRGSG